MFKTFILKTTILIYHVQFKFKIIKNSKFIETHVTSSKYITYLYIIFIYFNIKRQTTIYNVVNTNVYKIIL